MSDRLYLVLENGEIFEGKGFGAEGNITGEIVFSTGMTGYLETLTDKSYYGQIIIQTFPLIGNYGIIPSDYEADSIHARGYIVNQWCQEPSNFRSVGLLDTFLKEQNIPGIYGIDTRKLTRIIRENGVMNGRITSSLKDPEIAEISQYKVEKAVEAVTAEKVYTVNKGGEIKVALMDYGLKESIITNLTKRGCEVTVYPSKTSFEMVKAQNPDGIMLSNGPGDPAENTAEIETLKKLMKLNIPMFGICLGHQLLALASGFKTEKLKYGHRGANQPVKDLINDKVYITSQNHGYAVKSDTIDNTFAAEAFINVNDKTCEGISYKNRPVFSVQFHPEASAGPLDTAFLFDRFLSLINQDKGGRENAAQ